VGDLALHLVAMDVDPDEFEANPGAFDVPDSVVGFMAGELGDLPGGWPEPFRTKILKGKNYVVREEVLSPDHLKRLALPGLGRQALLNELLFPGRQKSSRLSERTMAMFLFLRRRITSMAFGWAKNRC